jgi:uncharacterized membrane protein
VNELKPLLYGIQLTLVGILFALVGAWPLGLIFGAAGLYISYNDYFKR